MENLYIIQAVIGLWLCFLIIGSFSRHKNAGKKLPPGPKPLPFIGNIRDFPPTGTIEYQHWLKHKDIYGPISTVSALNQTLIVVHDKQMAHDLLSKSSLKSSGRPVSEFVSNQCGYKKLLVFHQHDDNCQRSRRLIHQQIGTELAVTKFNSIIDASVGHLIVRILTQRDNTVQNLATFAGEVILKLTYGYSVDTKHPDPLVSLIERQGANLSRAAVPLAFPVDFIPILRYLPEGFPGASFKKLAREWSQVNQAVADVPYQYVRQQMATGSHMPSFVSNLLQQISRCDGETEKSCVEEEAIKWTAAVMYLGSSETTTSVLISFILAMVMCPKVHQKAQEEIDRVTGGYRLPRIEDRDRLPYIEGVVKESLRWATVAPMGMPHVMDEDVTLSGYCIPKGAIILPAVWWFLHDPLVYVEPGSFKPERYLPPCNEPDPKSEAFGFGRRICPGQNLTDSILFLAIAQILAAFNIRKAVDEQGMEVEVELKPLPGIVCRVAEFPHLIEPRSAKHVELIKAMEMEYAEEKSDANSLDTVLL